MERFAAFDPPEPGPVYRKTVRERTAITIAEWFSLNISLECVAKAFCCYVLQVSLRLTDLANTENTMNHYEKGTLY